MSNAPDGQIARHDEQPNFYDTQQLRALSPGEHHAELLILSRDQAIIEVVQGAAPGIVSVSHAPDLEHASIVPGVLVIDASIGSDLMGLLSRATQRFPGVVVVVVGKRDDVAALMRHTAAGGIFRFLLVPLAPGQTRLAIGAAIAQHLSIKAAHQNGGGAVAKSAASAYLPYGALGAGLLVVMTGLWFAVRTFTAKAPKPVPVIVEQPQLTQPPAEDPVQADLFRAKDALAQGRYIEPSGASAVDFYRKVLEREPTNAAARAGMRTAVDRVIESAEQSWTAGRIDAAVRAVEAVRAIDPTHPRLAFLDIQVGRERERGVLDRARDNTNRVRKLVEDATVDMQQQRLLRPAGDNARDTLLQARQLDPADPAVGLAIRQLGGNMTQAAGAAASAGNVAQARELIDAARKLGTTGAPIDAVERSLSEPPRPAQSLADSTAPNSAQTGAGSAVVEPRAAQPAPARATAIAPAQDAAQNNAGSAADPRTPVAPVTQPPPAAQEIPAFIEGRPGAGVVVLDKPGEILEASTLARTREVAPDYPTQAVMDGIEGWVDVDFTISTDGVPQDLKVRDANPRRVFDKAAINSLRQWRFEPIIENGAPVARRATLRVRFQRTR